VQFSEGGWLGAVEDFFENLPYLVVEWTIDFISDAEAVASVLAQLVQVAGAFVVGAFESLLNTLVNKILEPLLSPVVTFVKEAMDSYDSAIAASMNASVSDVANGGRYNGVVTLAHARQVLTTIGGNVMEFGFVIGAIVMGVALLVAWLTAGASFVVSFLLVALGMVTAAALAGLLVPPSFTANAVNATDTFVTKHLNSENSATLPQYDWLALSEVVGDGLDIGSLPLDIYLGVMLVEANSGTAAFTKPMISFAFDFAAIALDAIAWARSIFSLTVVALAVSAVAAVIATIPSVAVPGITKLTNYISLGLAWGAFIPAGVNFGVSLCQTLPSVC